MVWLGVALVWPRTVDIRTSIAYRAGPAVLFSYIIRTVLVPGSGVDPPAAQPSASDI